MRFGTAAWHLHLAAVYSSVALSMILNMKTSLSHPYIERYYRKAVSDEDVAKTRLLLELLFIRSGAYQLDIFSVSDVKVMIDSLCTM